MEGSRDNLILLSSGELMEVYCIARYTDGKVRIFLGMLNGVKEHLTVEYVYVDVLRLQSEVAVDNGAEVSVSVLIVITKSRGNNTEGIGNTVLTYVVGKLGNRVKGSQSAAGVASVHRISAGSKGLAQASAVGSITRLLTVYHVGGNRKDGEGMLRISVCGYLLKLVIEELYLLLSDKVGSVIVVTVLGEVTLRYVIGNKSPLSLWYSTYNYVNVQEVHLI